MHTYQKNGTQEVEPTTQLNLFSHNFSIVPTYTYNQDELLHSFSLSLNYNTNVNANTQSQYSTNSSNLNLSPSYSINLNKFDLNLGLNYSFGLSEAGNYATRRHVIGVFATQSYLKNKELSANANLSYGFDNNNLDDGSRSFTFSSGISYILLKYHNFSAGVSYSVSSYLSSETTQGYVRGYAGYTYSIPALSKFIYKDSQQTK
ncbi:hypothetical protein SDC9_180446 [bioreactor metagenome]|uniref:Outer membrane protein beta-barrel domain-containing protein n=1 Tax=bioreactor metagenome TaxID=1076179 RepID=A0A645HAZ3_9ZZZZ